LDLTVTVWSDGFCLVLQFEKGWNVVSADGVLGGNAVEVTRDEHDDIFDGLTALSP
jgi:hypothetical protein